ncbi:hypothetical protein SAMN05216338_10746 [Bradyrhizobium sp. Rc2d]|nr:hypothetical protein SAMN05216338_10746 [Bradyrhizobium sp. Rc2d]
MGYLHIGIAELETAEGKLYLYVAIDRTRGPRVGWSTIGSERDRQWLRPGQRSI